MGRPGNGPTGGSNHRSPLRPEHLLLGTWMGHATLIVPQQTIPLLGPLAPVGRNTENPLWIMPEPYGGGVMVGYSSGGGGPADLL